MKQHIFLLFFFSFFTHISIAQSPTELIIQRSDRFVEDDKADDLKVACKVDNGNLFTVRFGKKYCITNLLNTKFELLFNETIKKNKGEQYKGHIRVANKVKVFTVDASNRKERIINCYVFNLENGSHKKIQLTRLPIEKGKEVFETSKKQQVSFAISENQKYAAITMGSARKKGFTYFVYVFDSENLKTIYKKKFKEKDAYKFDPKGISIDNEATVFLLKKVWIETDEYAFDDEDEIENYEYQLHKITPKNKISTKISAEGKFIKSLKIRNLANAIQLLGFYADNGYDRIEGTCVFNINNESGTVTTSKISLFSKQLFYDVFGKSDRQWLLGFSLDYILEDSNGNAYILAENIANSGEFLQNPLSNNQSMIYTEKDVRGDILVLKVNIQGELLWGRGLHKISEYADYNAFLKDEKLHIIFNSGEKTLLKMKKRAVFKKKNFYTSLYDIVYDSDGNVSYHKIQDNEKKRFFIPAHGTFVNGMFLITSEDRYDRKYIQLN